MWGKPNVMVDNWYVDSWILYTQRSYVFNHRKESHITHLTPETRYNAPHRKKRKLNRKCEENGLSNK